MKIHHRLIIISTLASLCFGCILARTARADGPEIYAAFGDYSWKEFGDDNSRLVKESGVLTGVGFAYHHELPGRVSFTPAAEIFGGAVDYAGRACSTDPVTGVQTCRPAMSTVDYLGIALDGDVGVGVDTPQDVLLEPFIGLGVRAWRRDIKTSTDTGGLTASGYREDWITVNTRLGLRGGADISQTLRFFGEAGIKLPLYNQNTARLSSAGLGPDVTMHPGTSPALFGEAGLQRGRLKGSVFYDSLRFAKSAAVASGQYVYLQPKTTMDLYGIRVGMTF